MRLLPMEFVIVAAIVACLFGLGYAITAEQEEQEQWDQFSTAHNCHVVERRAPVTSVGAAFVPGNGRSGGGVAPVVTTTSAQVAWLCNDGVTYWRAQ